MTYTNKKDIEKLYFLQNNISTKYSQIYHNDKNVDI
jgi:hypothetical protein